ncbi:universal stress protein [Enterovirga sp. GCM10030262]|uniref:universal stress protein n=1 Tax=Enterovirga sp. GCM10030262 TaxID=3273391 RepID=UPI003620017B
MDRLLLATDFSTRSDRALRRAALIADKSGAAITLLHVIDDDQPKYLIERHHQAAAMLLEDAVKTIRQFDRVEADMNIMTGDVASSIVQVAEEIDAAMIVVGPYRRKLKNIFIGTTAERTIERSDRPVLMANGMPSGVYERTFLALDLDDASRSAVRAARALGVIEGTVVTAMHAFDAPAAGMMKRAMEVPDAIDHYVAGEEAQARPKVEEFLAELDIRPELLLLRPIEAVPAQSILACAEAENAELVVVGTNRRRGAERLLLRSVATEILRQADCDVLVVPADPRGPSPKQ